MNGKSPIIVPTPGTIASYRDSLYNVHKTTLSGGFIWTDDDPKVHLILHLIDDAPFFLMMSVTIVTLL